MKEVKTLRGPVRRWAVALVTIVLAVGLDATFGQVYRHGWMAAALNLLDDANVDAVLPLSTRPILKQYTGWAAFDKLLALASIMFGNVIDGSTPQLSLYGIHFGGQLVPIFTIMITEGLRVGNTNNILYYTVLWGLLMQLFGYAMIMPIYCVIHLFVSPVTSTGIRIRYLAPLDLRAIIPAFVFGYGLLTILFVYPFSSNDLRQWFCAIWQGFPLHVIWIQCTIASFIHTPSSTESRGALSARESRIMVQVVNFASIIAAGTQIFALFIIAIAKIAPDLLPHGTGKLLTFRNVFVPGPLHSSRPLASMAAEMHSFYIYDQYIGSAAALIWSITLWAGSKPSETQYTGYAAFGLEILCWTAVAGPATAALRILQKRDNAAMSNAQASSKTD